MVEETVYRNLGNFALVAILALPILINKLTLEPTKRGFFVDDETISYPYHSSTVPSWLLYLVGFGVPILTILIHYVNTARRGTESYIDVFFNQAFPTILAFLFGAAACQLQTSVCKYTVGRLRPHFLQVCNPLYDAPDVGHFPNYITNYTCQGNSNVIKVYSTKFTGHITNTFHSISSNQTGRW